MITKAITIDEECFQKRSFLVTCVSIVRKRIFSVHNLIYLN